MRHSLAGAILALGLFVACLSPARATDPAATEYGRGLALLDRGEHREALASLAAVRWRAGDADLRRLGAVGLARCEAAVSDTFVWDWAVLPADDMGSPAGLDGLPFALAWLLRDDLQAAGLTAVAPMARVVRALDLGRDAALASVSRPAEASRLPIQTIEGLKARLALIPGPSGKPLYAGPIDGEPGESLTDAIRGLQSATGIEPTGEADAPTMGALAEAYEKRMLEAPPAASPASLPSLARSIPARTFVRSTMRVREGRLVFGLVALDQNGRPLYGPVESAGSLEGAPEIVREALRDLIELVPAGEADPSAFRIDPPSSLGELQEAGRWALLRARGEASLARTRGQALRDANPGWDRVAAAVDADRAGGSMIRLWEERWRKQLLVLSPDDQVPAIDRCDRLSSDLPSIDSPGFSSRRGAVGILGETGRLRIEGSFP
jgi:hypothetical protein